MRIVDSSEFQYSQLKILIFFYNEPFYEWIIQRQTSVTWYSQVDSFATFRNWNCFIFWSVVETQNIPKNILWAELYF
jgi:hypothetical protein